MGMFSFIFIGAIWLTQSLRFLELIVNHNVSLKGYVMLVIYLLPDLIATTLPICILLAGIQVYQKFISDNELAVMRSVGLSNLQISKPLLFTGVLATGFVLLSNLFVIPYSFQNFRNREHAIKNDISASVINEGAFNVLKGVTIYVKERDFNGIMKGIFIHHDAVTQRNGSTTPAYTIFAEKGQLKHSKDHLSIFLLNGHRQEKNNTNNQITFLHFDEFHYDLTPLLRKNTERSIKPYERTLMELLYPDQLTTDTTTKKRMKVEAHQRIITPFLCILNAIIVLACLLFGDLRRRRRKRKIIIAVATALIIQGMIIAILNRASTHYYMIYIGYGFLFIAAVVSLYILASHKVETYTKKLLGNWGA